jgi:exo-1,4-beta-D-glucosaminidase
MPADKLWPRDKDNWEFHSGRNAFQSLDRFTKAMDARYGKSNSIEEFAYKAQVMNYELMRPMFEAFSINRYKATGVVQWMLNSAWPEMYWQLYDSYLLPNAAYYATKKAGTALQAMYHYQAHSIYLVNDHLEDEKDITVKVRVFDIRSKEIFHQDIHLDIAPNSSVKILDLPSFEKSSQVYFIRLDVIQDELPIADNFYWISQKPDVLDYKAAVPNWYYHTPSKEYADFDMLNSMEKTDIDYEVDLIDFEENVLYKITLVNHSQYISFFNVFPLSPKYIQMPSLNEFL